jgi:hypothetical protein
VDVCGGHVCWHLGDVALAGGRSSSLAGGATPPLLAGHSSLCLGQLAKLAGSSNSDILATPTSLFHIFN